MPRPTLTKVADFHGHRDCIYTLAGSFRSGHLLSAGAKGVIAEWNIEQQEAKAWAKVDASVYSLLLIPEKGLLLAGLSNGEVMFLDMKNGETIKRIQAHKAGVFDIQLFPDGNWAMAAGGDGVISVWNLDNPALEHRTQAAPKSIRTLCFSPDHTALFAGSSDNYIRQFNLNLKMENEWEAHNFSVFRLLFSPDGKWLVSGSRDAQINVWNPREATRHLNIPAHLYAINDLVLHPTLPLLFSGSMDKSIKLWDTETWELQKVIDYQRNQNHRNGVNRMLWHEGHLFSCSDDRLVKQWKLTHTE